MLRVRIDVLLSDLSRPIRQRHSQQLSRLSSIFILFSICLNLKTLGLQTSSHQFSHQDYRFNRYSSITFSFLFFLFSLTQFLQPTSPSRLERDNKGEKQDTSDIPLLYSPSMSYLALGLGLSSSFWSLNKNKLVRRSSSSSLISDPAFQQHTVSFS